MAIKLHFKNDNDPGVTLQIYRDVTEIDRGNLPEPIATINTHVTEWIDETAIKGGTYYYVFKTTGATDFKITRNIKIIALDDKGVGGDKLYYGNLEYGYYGITPVSTFFSPTQLAAALGLTFTTYGTPTLYHKFSDKGKTIFVPNGFIGKGLSYNELAEAGLVEGKVVQYGQFQYKVRLMQGYDPSLEFETRITAANMVSEVASIPNFTSEYDRFIYPLARPLPASQISHNVDDRTQAQLGYATNVQFLMAEISADSGLCLCRGSLTESGVGLVYATAVTPETKNAFMTFLPLLELVTDEV